MRPSWALIWATVAHAGFLEAGKHAVSIDLPSLGIGLIAHLDRLNSKLTDKVARGEIEHLPCHSSDPFHAGQVGSGSNATDGRDSLPNDSIRLIRVRIGGNPVEVRTGKARVLQGQLKGLPLRPQVGLTRAWHVKDRSVLLCGSGRADFNRGVGKPCLLILFLRPTSLLLNLLQDFLRVGPTHPAG